jgi:hypothetical protein
MRDQTEYHGYRNMRGLFWKTICGVGLLACGANAPMPFSDSQTMDSTQTASVALNRVASQVGINARYLDVTCFTRFADGAAVTVDTDPAVAALHYDLPRTAWVGQTGVVRLFLRRPIWFEAYDAAGQRMTEEGVRARPLPRGTQVADSEYVDSTFAISAAFAVVQVPTTAQGVPVPSASSGAVVHCYDAAPGYSVVTLIERADSIALDSDPEIDGAVVGVNLDGTVAVLFRF